MTINALLYDVIDESKKRYYSYKQQPWDEKEVHLHVFKISTDVVKHYDGSLLTIRH